MHKGTLHIISMVTSISRPGRGTNTLGKDLSLIPALRAGLMEFSGLFDFAQHCLSACATFSPSGPLHGTHYYSQPCRTPRKPRNAHGFPKIACINLRALDSGCADRGLRVGWYRHGSSWRPASVPADGDTLVGRTGGREPGAEERRAGAGLGGVREPAPVSVGVLRIPWRPARK